MASAWRLVPFEDSQKNVVSAAPMGDPLSTISDRKVLKKARAIWDKIKDRVVLDSDQRVVYTPNEKGSALPLLLSFLASDADSTRPLDLHRFVSVIRPYVSVTLIAPKKKRLYKNIK
jgi:hypothetical protein